VSLIPAVAAEPALAAWLDEVVKEPVAVDVMLEPVGLISRALAALLIQIVGVRSSR
jgi:hypothetical protein